MRKLKENKPLFVMLFKKSCKVVLFTPQVHYPAYFIPRTNFREAAARKVGQFGSDDHPFSSL